jgi:hypothetical protein
MFRGTLYVLRIREDARKHWSPCADHAYLQEFTAQATGVVPTDVGFEFGALCDVSLTSNELRVVLCVYLYILKWTSCGSCPPCYDMTWPSTRTRTTIDLEIFSDVSLFALGIHPHRRPNGTAMLSRHGETDYSPYCEPNLRE